MSGERGIAVEVIRPRRKPAEWVGWIIGSNLALLGSAALFMLLLGACHHEIDQRIPAFGYWQTLLGLYTLRFLLTVASPWDGYRMWTREAKS